MRSDIRKVIIDFDDTLFNTHGLKEVLSAAAGRFGFSRGEFWFTYKQARDQSPGVLNYTFVRHAEALHALHPAFVAPQILQDEFENVMHNQKFVFSDAYPLLDFLKNQNKILILLSLGETAFQRKKVESSGLEHFFDRVEIVDTHKLNAIPLLVDQNEPVYFLNDKPFETKEILANYPHWQALLRQRQDLSPVHYQESGLPCFENLSDLHTYLITHQ